jgi:phage terminase large subunit
VATAEVHPLLKLYADAIRERHRRLLWLRQHPEELPALKAYYRAHLADWINDWCVTIDPRNIRKGLPVVLPFLLDDRQREWVAFTLNNWRLGRYGTTIKSRDVGVSWLIVCTSTGMATLWDDNQIGWGSYKADKVDQLGDLGSLFEKGRQLLEHLPHEFCAGYDWRFCSMKNRLLFPATRSAIIGEVGDSIGRGGRTSIYFVDETAHLEHDQLVDASLSKTTDCRQDASTVFGMNNTFATRAHDSKIITNGQRFDFDWRQNPRMTPQDYQDFLDLYGEVITAQELDRNFQASVEGVVCPAEWVNTCIDAHLKIKNFPQGGEYASALDVADEGLDRNGQATRHGVVLEWIDEWSGKHSDIYATTERAFRGCDVHGPARRLRYDADGLGAGVKGDARTVNEVRLKNHGLKIDVSAFRGSSAVMDPTKEWVKGRKNEDYFLNFKAQCWWWLRLLFQNTWRAVNGRPFDPQMLISISSEIPGAIRARLLIELSQPTYSQNQAGKLLIDKQPDGTKSPNLGDAVMILYAPLRRMKIDEQQLEEL